MLCTENFVEEEGGRDQHASSTRNEPQRIKRYSYQRQRGGTDDMTAINPLPPPHQPVVMTSGYFPPGIIIYNLLCDFKISIVIHCPGIIMSYYVSLKY